MPSQVQAVAYLVVCGQQNPQILNEFLHSFRSLRRFHPEVPVFLYWAGLHPAQLEFLRGLPHLLDFPIGIGGSALYADNHYKQRFGWVFPELRVLVAKIDCLLLSPGDTLFLDTDTEVVASLDEVFASDDVWMHVSEGRIGDHDRDWGTVVDAIDVRSFGWDLPARGLRMLNSGAIHVPRDHKPALYAAKELLWAFTTVPAAARGDNRLDEQLALSIALEQATGGRVREVHPRVDHYWLEKYEASSPRYPMVFQPATHDGDVVLLPRPPRTIRPAFRPVPSTGADARS